mmetsp:Transcript_50263/g.125941  ORF Transcript_50263/g.125941 Transcript_50263/m.125941 type:complete len:224 (+) Transcript_50263:153-824(+)
MSAAQQWEDVQVAEGGGRAQHERQTAIKRTAHGCPFGVKGRGPLPVARDVVCLVLREDLAGEPVECRADELLLLEEMQSVEAVHLNRRHRGKHRIGPLDLRHRLATPLLLRPLSFVYIAIFVRLLLGLCRQDGLQRVGVVDQLQGDEGEQPRPANLLDLLLPGQQDDGVLLLLERHQAAARSLAAEAVVGAVPVDDADQRVDGPVEGPADTAHRQALLDGLIR